MFKINLVAIAKVKEFINISNKVPYNILLKSGRYTVDGKSIMGIFSLDLSKPIEVDVEPAEKAEEFKTLVKDFLA